MMGNIRPHGIKDGPLDDEIIQNAGPPFDAVVGLPPPRLGWLQGLHGGQNKPAGR
jgi:hypothetical protein